MKCLLNLPVLFLLAVPASAQIDARKGDVFTLMISPSILYEDGICILCNGWRGDPITIFSADITPETTWVGEFPALLELQVEQIDTGKKDYVEVELRNRAVAIMGVFPLLKSLLPVVVAFLLPTTDTLDHRRVGNGTHRHGLFQEPMEELPAMA